MKLKRIDERNIWEVVKLDVFDDQKDFVATNNESLLEAYVALTSGIVVMPFALYEGQNLVGFIMFGYGNGASAADPKVALGNYCIWRFMIDKHWQRQGLGRAALETALDFLKADPLKKGAKAVWLSYEKENEVAKKLYASFGFVENGEYCDGELVAVRPL